MKRVTYPWMSFVIVLLLLLATVLPATAAGQTPLCSDEAGLLTSAECAELEARLTALSEEHQVTVAICTVDSIGSYTASTYAKQYYSSATFPYQDGILLLVSMKDRDWYMLPKFGAEDRFNDAALDLLEEEVIPCLSSGDYAEAFAAFADICGDVLSETAVGKSYTPPFDWQGALLPALIVGLVVALITVTVMRSKLKTVRARTEAAEYTRAGSMKLAISRDLYLYRTVTRRAKPKNNSSSSGGRSSSSGGRGGKF